MVVCLVKSQFVDLSNRKIGWGKFRTGGVKEGKSHHNLTAAQAAIQK